MAAPSRRQDAPTVKRQAVEADVLRATESLLAQGATYRDLAVERIASEAGLSRTAFYFYFSDKRDLLTRLTEDVMAELYGVADQWFSGAGDMHDALRRAADLYLTHGPLIRAVVEVAAYDPEIAAFWRGVIERFVTATQERIEAEQRDGRAPGVTDPRTTAFALVWMLERVLHEAVVQGDAIDAEALVATVEHIWQQAIYGESASGRLP